MPSPPVASVVPEVLVPGCKSPRQTVLRHCQRLQSAVELLAPLLTELIVAKAECNDAVGSEMLPPIFMEVL